MIDGMVFDIQRYSIHDGPGIRTVVFLKGCPLRCEWCSNPEGQKASPELEFFPARCQKCGRCVESCPRQAINPDLESMAGEKIARPSCDLCGKCVAVCPSNALMLTGRRQTVAQVLEEVRKDAAYYRRSGGGVTLSGGDAVAQPAFARALLAACRDVNIHTAVETSGVAPVEEFLQVVEHADLVLYDLKHMDPEQHRRLTGVGTEHVQVNLRALVRQEKVVTVRMPVIPGRNNSAENLRATGEFVATLGLRQIHLMPFHQLGKDKYSGLGMSYTLADLPPLLSRRAGTEAVEAAKMIMESWGLEVVIGG